MAKVTKDQAEIEKLQQESAFLHAQAQALELATRRKELKLERELHELNILRASNVENRVYDFAVDVSGFSTEAAIQVLSRWARLSYEPITLRFSSPGGSVFAGLGLYDAVFVKENHRPYGNLAKLRSRPRQFEIEVRNLREVAEALMLRPRVILFDNFPPALLRKAVRMVRRADPRILLETSGGITLANVRRYAAAGVDRISVGALTHSVKAIDFSLLLQ